MKRLDREIDGAELAQLTKKSGRVKGAQRTARGDLQFDSRKEAERFDALTLMQKTGVVLWFIRQPAFDLPGGTKYRADFLIVWKDGTVTVEDVKGHRTDVYKLKKKQVESLYPIEIQEV
ncbi:MAG: hypothetical protein DHS20C21_03060 [Gemmatimonadota bacterium]|nr:MAG: hypothetical protein DHS20C21_03060 [Gemmatimonadota bacterium]